MGIVSSAKGEFVKVLLEKLTDGDKGSTLLGAIAGGALIAGPNFSDLFSPDQTKRMHAAALLVAGVITGLWGFYIGRQKKPAGK